MALFLTNICTFDGCGLIFPRLDELIEHIEYYHIDFDSDVMEELENNLPESIPLSYAQRFTSDKIEKPDSPVTVEMTPPRVGKQVALEHHNYSLSFLDLTGSDSEIDDLELASPNDIIADLDLDDEFSSAFILRYGSKQCFDDNTEKPFACPIPGCMKRYKNINGIKYHAKNGHKKTARVHNKGTKCHCGKTYKTAHGLKNHVFTMHRNSEVILPSSSSLPQSEESHSLLSISRLPNDFEGLYENGHDNTQEQQQENQPQQEQQQQQNEQQQQEFDEDSRDTINVCSDSDIEMMELESALLASSNHSDANSLEDKSEASDGMKTKQKPENAAASFPTVQAQKKEPGNCKELSDDIIDVGDANDSEFPYF